MPNTSLSPSQKKHFRQIGHNLKPIVTIGSNGLSEGVINELNRALDDHELIKVRLAVVDRDHRAEAARELCEQCQAECIQTIGKIVLLYKANPKPNPKLSNLLR